LRCACMVVTKITKRKAAATRIQAVTRGWIVRNRMKHVFEQSRERIRLRDKNHKLNKKLLKIQKERQELAKKGVVSGDIRQSWEEGILNHQHDAEMEDDLTPTGYAIEQRQKELKELQLIYKVADGILKPLHKNLQALMETYAEYQAEYVKHDEERKASELKIEKLIKRRKEAEARIQALNDELNGKATKMSPMTMGTAEYHCVNGMHGIMAILKAECKDKELIEDVGEMVRELKATALSDSAQYLMMSPQRNALMSPQRNAMNTPQRNAMMTPQRNAMMTPQRNAMMTPQKKTFR
jgi:chromosome segregation ATPase